MDGERDVGKDRGKQWKMARPALWEDVGTGEGEEGELEMTIGLVMVNMVGAIK